MASGATVFCFHKHALSLSLCKGAEIPLGVVRSCPSSANAAPRPLSLFTHSHVDANIRCGGISAPGLNLLARAQKDAQETPNVIRITLILITMRTICF